MGHPIGKVAQASHSTFVAFVSSGKDSDENERVLLKEQLVFYYIQRSLEVIRPPEFHTDGICGLGYSQITPFEGISSGVAALVRHLPAGSPSIFYAIHSLVDKAHNLHREVMTQEADLWKNWQRELEPCPTKLDEAISRIDFHISERRPKHVSDLGNELATDNDGNIACTGEIGTDITASTLRPGSISGCDDANPEHVGFGTFRPDFIADYDTGTSEHVDFGALGIGISSDHPFRGNFFCGCALVRHLPAGSPSIFYAMHSLVDKAHNLHREVMTQEADLWKNWQRELEPCKKILDLLLRLLSLVDIQVLPSLMKQLAELISIFPRDGQNMVLNELYSLVAESDDVTRKPALVSWLQSLSYICSQVTSSSPKSKVIGCEENAAFTGNSGELTFNRINARL
ncbi:hypothetical protein U1Q18_018826 [Sarracenia purpurea var. burkii]